MIFQGASKPCALRSYPEGHVCVCNTTYCDTIDEDDVTVQREDQIIVITSSAVSKIKELEFNVLII